VQLGDNDLQGHTKISSHIVCAIGDERDGRDEHLVDDHRGSGLGLSRRSRPRPIATTDDGTSSTASASVSLVSKVLLAKVLNLDITYVYLSVAILIPYGALCWNESLTSFPYAWVSRKMRRVDVRRIPVHLSLSKVT
jgi:hypothetical protein